MTGVLPRANDSSKSRYISCFELVGRSYPIGSSAQAITYAALRGLKVCSNRLVGVLLTCSTYLLETLSWFEHVWHASQYSSNIRDMRGSLGHSLWFVGRTTHATSIK